MFPCENRSLISVNMNDEGEFEVKVSSTCGKAQRYLEGLGNLTMIDLVDKPNSKIFKNFIVSEMSANCLVLSGVLTASWVEAGMIARSMAKKQVPLLIEFVDE